MLQSLSVRPVFADGGSETGKFEIPAGGRRFQVLSLLEEQKRLAKTTPIPRIVRDATSAILAEDDSLAENMQRAALHPLDHFRAFVALREKGQGDEEIAAAFFVTPQVVKQRLQLAAVASALLDLYAEDQMTKARPRPSCLQSIGRSRRNTRVRMSFPKRSTRVLASWRSRWRSLRPGR